MTHPTGAAWGVDGCKGGWFFFKLSLSSNYATYGVCRRLEQIVRKARPNDRILVDIPIGLPDTDDRECDQLAKDCLKPSKPTSTNRSGSVFPVPSRAALYAPDFASGQRRNHEKMKKGFSKQAWDLGTKIREVDQLLRSDRKARQIVSETHPEICFWALAGRTHMAYGKDSPEGMDERMRVMTDHGVQDAVHAACEDRYANCLKCVTKGRCACHRATDIERDDIVDAMACAVTARLILNEPGTRRTLPTNPPSDKMRLPMQIVYALPPVAASGAGSTETL